MARFLFLLDSTGLKGRPSLGLRVKQPCLPSRTMSIRANNLTLVTFHFPFWETEAVNGFHRAGMTIR